MPDRFVFDLDAEYPDIVIDTMRRSLLEQIRQLQDAATQQQVHSDQLDGAFLLVLTAFDFAETMLQAVVPLQQAASDLSDRLTNLQAQVDAQASQLASLMPPAAGVSA